MVIGMYAIGRNTLVGVDIHHSLGPIAQPRSVGIPPAGMSSTIWKGAGCLLRNSSGRRGERAQCVLSLRVFCH